MSNTKGKANKELATAKKLITSATPQQKERLVGLVDRAIDTMESALDTGSEKARLTAAQDVMDRAGLPKNTKTTTDASPIGSIPAEVFTEFVGGLAKMFNVQVPPPTKQPKNVTPEEDSFTLNTAKSTLTPKKQKKKKEPETGIPESLLAQYREE